MIWWEEVLTAEFFSQKSWLNRLVICMLFKSKKFWSRCIILSTFCSIADNEPSWIYRENCSNQFLMEWAKDVLLVCLLIAGSVSGTLHVALIDGDSSMLVLCQQAIKDAKAEGQCNAQDIQLYFSISVFEWEDSYCAFYSFPFLSVRVNSFAAAVEGDKKGHRTRKGTLYESLKSPH